MQTKICTKCGEEKPATSEFFHKAKRGKHGVRANCKVCENEYNREYNKLNKETRRRYREENKDKLKEYFIDNYKKTKERRSVYQKIRNRDNRPKLRIAEASYRDRNRGKVNSYSKKYRANKRRALPSISNQEDEQIIQLYNQAQELSKSDMFNTYHVDHIVPLQGKLPDGKRVLGAHRLSNLQLLMDCVNLSKLNNITYKDLKKAKEGVDYIFVPDDYHDDPNKYPEIGFDVELCLN